MRLLFLKTKHIGDALLMTPALTAVREQYPQAEIWVVVRAGTEGILAGCPAIDRLLTTAAPESDRRDGARWRDLALVRELRRRKFDLAFELGDGDRGRWLAWLSGARVRCGASHGQRATWLLNRPIEVEAGLCHQAERDFRIVSGALRLAGEPPPLSFAGSRAVPWAPLGTEEDFAVVHPLARWPQKRWQLPYWIATGRQLLERTAALVISSGPDAEERAQNAALARALGGRAVSTDGQASWAQLAWLLWRARLFVGVDTAAMHLAAACQCPTVAIFGPSVPGFWRPWRVQHEIVQAAPGPDFPLTAAEDAELKRRQASQVPPEAVLAACSRLMRGVGDWCRQAPATADPRPPCA